MSVVELLLALREYYHDIACQLPGGSSEAADIAYDTEARAAHITTTLTTT